MTRFEIYLDKANEWRWRLVSCRNGNIIADSGEGYKDKGDCLSAIRSIKESAAEAALIEEDKKVSG